MLDHNQRSARGQHEPVLREIDWEGTSHKSHRSRRQSAHSARSHITVKHDLSGSNVSGKNKRQTGGSRSDSDSRDSSQISVTTPESKISVDISEESE